jgi:hypothetical protein
MQLMLTEVRENISLAGRLSLAEAVRFMPESGGRSSASGA